MSPLPYSSLPVHDPWAACTSLSYHQFKLGRSLRELFSVEARSETEGQENIKWPSLVTQMVKTLPAAHEAQVQPLGWEDPLETRMATHSSVLAWRILWVEEPGGLQSVESQIAWHSWVTLRDPKWSCNSVFKQRKSGAVARIGHEGCLGRGKVRSQTQEQQGSVERLWHRGCSVYEQVDPQTPALGRSPDPASVFATLPKALSPWTGN